MNKRIANRRFIYLPVLATFALILCGCNKANKPVIPLTDIDGNTYKTVEIGTQTWMAENLKTSRFNNGTYIPLISDDGAWASLTTPGFCWYNNDSVSFKDTYGALYNGYTINTWNICPAGWHVPEKQELLTLRDFLGDSVIVGGKLKETGTSHWLSPNTGANNSSGFTALGSGIRYFEGTYASVLSFTSFWSASGLSNDDTWYIGLYFNNSAFITNHISKKQGFSVRCLKD
jgi:uncharacterized protein (TIGR02145 family)